MLKGAEEDNKKHRLKVTKFTDLVAWQEGHRLVLMIYDASAGFPSKETFGLISQMRRAAVSFTSNIAEGFSKRSGREKEQFYSIAQGSLIELQNQLMVSRDVGYISKDGFDKIAEQTVICHKLIIGLMKAVQLGKCEKKSR